MDKYEPKELILLALYAEYCKDCPDFGMVRSGTLDMEERVFRWGIMKLKLEGCVDGINWIPPQCNDPDKVLAMNRKNLCVTVKGMEEAERMLQLKGEKRAMKLQKLACFFGELCMETMKQLILNSLGA